MSQDNFQEKTEQATPKRREDTRKKGKVAQSKEIPSVLILISSLGIFFFSGSWIFWNLSDFMRGIFQNIGTMHIQNVSAVSAFSFKIFGQVLLILAPFMLTVLIAGIAANLFQVGFLFTGEPLTPKLSKIDPIKGMKKFFSLKSVVELVKSLIKILLIGAVTFLTVKGEAGNFTALMHMEVGSILLFIGKVAFKISFYACLVLLVLAVLDYAYQRWEYEKDIKMTKQEVKEESKQRDGDPQVKAKIRKIQLEMSQRRMMESVPDATVVITNPTRLAIAIKYDSDDMAAPRVTAKGAGFIALRIREIAKENDVPLVENKPLAQSLYKAAEIGEYIPVNLYRAVAEILAYVYRLRGMGT